MECEKDVAAPPLFGEEGTYGNLLPMRPDLLDVIPQMPRAAVAQSKAGNNTHLSSESRRGIF